MRSASRWRDSRGSDEWREWERTQGFGVQDQLVIPKTLTPDPQGIGPKSNRHPIVTFLIVKFELARRFPAEAVPWDPRAFASFDRRKACWRAAVYRIDEELGLKPEVDG